MATSITKASAALTQQLIDLKNSTKSSIINSFNSYGDRFTQTLLDTGATRLSISGIATSLSAIASAAKKNDVSSDVLNNVQRFAASLQSEGYDTVSTLKYLSIVRGLAEDDPDKLSELFSNETMANTTAAISTLTT